MQPTVYYPLALAASCCAIVISVGALLYVRRQIQTVIRNREADLLLKLYQASASAPLDQALRTAWSLRGERPSDIQRAECEQVCVFFELVGTLVHRGYTGTELIEGFFGSLVTGSFEALRGYIDDMRTTPYNGNFALNFERLRDRIAAADEVSQAHSQHPLARNTDAGRLA